MVANQFLINIREKSPYESYKGYCLYIMNRNFTIVIRGYLLAHLHPGHSLLQLL